LKGAAEEYSFEIPILTLQVNLGRSWRTEGSN
jgi:hypothetical protein